MQFMVTEIFEMYYTVTGAHERRRHLWCSCAPDCYDREQDHSHPTCTCVTGDRT